MILDWFTHPFLPDSWCATTDKYSFIVLRDTNGGDFYETSWQDRHNGGSASNTREGPFKTVREAKNNCERIRKELARKH